MGDEMIHTAHCSPARCTYGDPACPVVRPELPGGRAGDVLAGLQADGVEFAVRDRASGWIYALPKRLPKDLEDKRGSLEAAEWHRNRVAGPDIEWMEIVRRPVGPWTVVG